MATREEVMTAADRLIRRGELGQAAGLLEMWLRENPADAGAQSKLANVRELADPNDLRRALPRPAVVPKPVGAAAAPVVAQKPLPSDPVEAMKELLERVKANRRK